MLRQVLPYPAGSSSAAADSKYRRSPPPPATSNPIPAVIFIAARTPPRPARRTHLPTRQTTRSLPPPPAPCCGRNQASLPLLLRISPRLTLSTPQQRLLVSPASLPLQPPPHPTSRYRSSPQPFFPPTAAGERKQPLFPLRSHSPAPRSQSRSRASRPTAISLPPTTLSSIIKFLRHLLLKY